jgi:hypothetical protein
MSATFAPKPPSESVLIVGDYKPITAVRNNRNIPPITRGRPLQLPKDGGTRRRKFPSQCLKCRSNANNTIPTAKMNAAHQSNPAPTKSPVRNANSAAISRASRLIFIDITPQKQRKVLMLLTLQPIKHLSFHDT